MTSEFNEFQKDVCELPEEPASAVPICPTCTIDPNYVEPTWWNTTEPYLNLKYCEYQVVVRSKEDPRNLPQAYINFLAQKSVKKGIRHILRHYNKLVKDELICAFLPDYGDEGCDLYLPPSLVLELGTPENPIPNNIDLYNQVQNKVALNKQLSANQFNSNALEVRAYVKDIYYGSNFETFKILISIPAEDIDLSEVAPFSEEDQQEINQLSADTDFVIIDGKALKLNMVQIRAAFKLYSKYQSAYYNLQGVTLLQDYGVVTRKFYLNKFDDLFVSFKDELSDLLRDNNYRLRSYNSPKTVEKIKIIFDKSDPNRPYAIKNIKAKYRGCPYKRLSGLGSFKKLEVVKNQTLLHYIVRLQPMIDTLSNSGQEVPWLDFIAENTYPPLEIDFGITDNTSDELDSCLEEEYLGELKDRILEEIFSFSEAIQFSISTNNCVSLKDHRFNNLYTKTVEALAKEEREKRKNKRKLDRAYEREQKDEKKERVEQLREQIKARLASTTEVGTNYAQADSEFSLGILSAKSVELAKLRSRKDFDEEARLEEEISILKQVISETQKNIKKYRSEGDVAGIGGNVGANENAITAAEEFIFDQDIKMKNKKARLQALKKIKRKEKFEDNVLNGKNIKRLWNEAREETAGPSLFVKIGENRRTRKSDRADHRAVPRGKERRAIRKKQGRNLLTLLNPCDWSQLLFEVIECLLGGISFQEALPIIVSAALKKSSPFVLQTILSGLPLSTQREVEKKVKEELKKISDDASRAFKTPWDAAAEELNKEEVNDNSESVEEQLNNTQPDLTEEDLDQNIVTSEIIKLNKELEELNVQIDELTEDVTSLLETQQSVGEENFLFNSDLREKEQELQDLESRRSEVLQQIKSNKEEFLGREQSAAGAALEDITKIIFEAYIEALLQLANIDELAAMLDKIPGANAFKRVFLQTSCPNTNAFKLGVDDLFGSLKLGFCEDGANGYILPGIPEIPSLRSIGLKGAMNVMLDKFRESLKSLIEEIILSLFIKILELLSDAQCKSIGALGSLIANELAGQSATRNGLMDAINDAFCQNQGNPSDTQDDLLGRAGIPASAKAGLANGISKVMPQSQIKQAMLDCGGIPDSTWVSLYEVIEEEYPDLLLFISGPTDIREIFCTMGNYLSDAQRDRLADSMAIEDQSPPGHPWCSNEEALKRFDQQVDFYKDQGLDPAAALDFVNGLKQKDLDDLSDVMQAFMSGPESILEDAFRGAFGPADETCLDGVSIIPPLPQEIKDFQAGIAEGMFETLSTAFTRDIIGQRDSLIDNILQDTEGKRLTGFFQHQMRVNSQFLWPNAGNTEQEVYQKYNQSGYLTRALMGQSLFPEDSYDDNRRPKLFADDNYQPTEGQPAAETLDGGSYHPDDIRGPKPSYLFPKTVGIHARKQLLESAGSVGFDSSNASTPTAVLAYQDISGDTASDDIATFDKKFVIRYKNYTYRGAHNNDGEYAIIKSDIFKSESLRTNINGELVNDEGEVVDTSSLGYSKINDFRMRISYGLEKYPNKVETLANGWSRTVPYINYLFKQHVNSLNPNSAVDQTMADTMYDVISNQLFHDLISKILSKDTPNLDEDSPLYEVPVGFRFGYNSETLGYKDLLYVNPKTGQLPEGHANGAPYDLPEDEKILGESSSGSDRVSFLDPAVYGGRYSKPKLYIEPTKHGGWFRMLQMLVPELDGCEPKRADFFFLKEISDRVASLESSIPRDKRLEFDKDCIQEPPFDVLLTPNSAAYLEGIVTATCRLYSLESILRCLPIYSNLKLDFETNYDSALLSVIVDKMEEEMIEQGTWGSGWTLSRVKGYTYWLLFLEQVVQSVFRQVEDGLLPKDSVLINLLKQANQVSKNYVRPEATDISLLGDIAGLSINNDGTLTDLTFNRLSPSDNTKKRAIRMVRALAFGAYGVDFKLKLKEFRQEGRSPKFKTLNLRKLKRVTREFAIHQNKDIAKKILRYVITNELESYAEKLNQYMTPRAHIQNLSAYLIGGSGIVTETLPGLGTSAELDDDFSYGDILEDTLPSGWSLSKYLLITRFDRLTGSVIQVEKTIADFTEDLQREDLFPRDSYISDVLGDAELLLDENRTPFGYTGSIGIKFGVKLAYDGLTLAKFEQDIQDRTFEQLLADIENSTTFGEDLKCYIDNLITSQDFDLVVNILLPTRRVGSISGIYMYDGFIDSVGIDNSERNDKNRGREAWKGRVFDDTRDKLRDMFAASLRDKGDTKAERDRHNKDKRKRAKLKNVMPDTLVQFDRSVKWWQVRKRTDRPYDLDGEDCANDLIDLFGG